MLISVIRDSETGLVTYILFDDINLCIGNVKQQYLIISFKRDFSKKIECC